MDRPMPQTSQNRPTPAEPFTTVDMLGEGPVRHLVLNRPHRHNAQNLTMWKELSQAAALLSADPEVSVVILRGRGRSFSSGIDLDEFTRPGGFIRTLAEHPVGDPDPMLPAIAVAQHAVVELRRAPFLTIAQLHGVALGAGLQLALACDIRITANDCRLGLLEATKGMIPDLGATHSLRRLVGSQRALDLILTAREFSGDRAHELGIALLSVSEPELCSAVAEYALRVAALSRTAVAHVKAAVDTNDEALSLHIAAAGQAACIRSLPTHPAP